MRESLDGTQRYLACPRVTQRPIFCFVSTDNCADGACQVWTLDDDYSYGVIQSGPHWAWRFANCSKIKRDYRYTRRSVWDTFPWPQSVSDAQVEAVAEAGREVRRVRDEALTKINFRGKRGLRAVYRTLELAGRNPLKDVHAALDAAVLDAYGFSGSEALLQQLLDLNLALIPRAKRGQAVVGPGVPPGFADAAGLVSDDCVTA